MKRRSMLRRRGLDVAIKWLSGLAACGGCFVLGWILLMLLQRGIGAMNWDFFTKLPTPPGVPGGGMANAIAGTLAITLMASLLGVPLGLMGGVFLAEFGRGTRLAEAIRFSANVLMGIPSIIIGVCVYGIMVRPSGSFSGYAGALALAIIMLPIVLRTTEDMLLMVPGALREAAMALGAPRWKVAFGIYFRAAKAGVLTGILLAVARVSGETAPLLFTALNSPYWNRFDSIPGMAKSFAGPTGNLTVTIFNQAMSPYPDWQKSAWAASLLITCGVLVLTITARALVRRRGE